MRGSWITTFALGGVILLLTVFLGLQYNWLRQAGEAERERMQRRVEADAKNYADDLNREIQAAFYNFQTDAAAWERSDWAEFNERYNYWKGRTNYPGLIQEFVFLGANDARPLRFDPAAGAFTAAEVPANVLGLRATLNDPKKLKTFYEDEFAFVMPVHKPERQVGHMIIRRLPSDGHLELDVPPPLGFLVIMLDRDVVTGRILPDLAAKHFPDGDFRVSVGNKAGETVYASAPVSGTPDANVAMFNLTSDRMMFFREGMLKGRSPAGEQRDIVINERVESQTFTRTEATPAGSKESRFTIHVQPRGTNALPDIPISKTAVTTMKGESPDLWSLNVQHVAGSIDAFSRGEQRKYFAIGLGVYLLLVGAIAAIVISALRSKRFAQRQIDFVSSVSHEFRTPLAVIYSASENLADGVANDREQVARYGSLIKGEGRKLSAMVEQILQFAGARSGKKKYTFTSVDPSDVVAAALNECSPLLEEKGFTVEMAVDENLPTLNADTEALSTALQNLINNSIKYSNGSRWIRLSAANGGRTVKISVEDRGIGIAGDDLRHIFEPFYRARGVVDAQIHGNGLGLALVREITNAHSGKVHANSEIGKGSRFTIELPV